MIIKSNIGCSIVFFCLISSLFLHTCLLGFVCCYSFNIIITCFIYLHHTHLDCRIICVDLLMYHKSMLLACVFGGASASGIPTRNSKTMPIIDNVRCQQAKCGFSPGEPGDWQSRHLNNVSKERNGSQRRHRCQRLSPGGLQLPTAHVKPSRLSLF
jgi:hypothetical protein